MNIFLDKYDEKVQLIESKNSENEMRIAILEEKVKYFEKKWLNWMIMISSLLVLIVVLNFQTDYDDEVETVNCPECGKAFDVDWDDEGER